MTYEELNAMSKDDRDTYLDTLDDDELEELVDSLLEELSENEKVKGCVFETACVYYIIRNGHVSEISSDAGYNPRGSWFPDIVTGPPAEIVRKIEKIACSVEKYGDMEAMFEEITDYTGGEFDDDTVIEMFEDNEDEDNLKLYKCLMKAVENSEGAFESVNDFYLNWQIRELDEGVKYYIWEDDYIDMYENIQDCGEGRGDLDGMDNREWIDELLSLDC